jgi:hypothetical protein
MATDKLFTVAGTTCDTKGVVKCRFANDVMRVKIFTKGCHTNILFVELPGPMTKLEAVRFISELDEFQGPAEQAAITDYIDRNTKPVREPRPRGRKPAVKNSIMPMNNVEDTVPDNSEHDQVDIDSLEDAPF